MPNDALLHTRSAVAELGGARHGYARFMIGLPRGTVQVVPYQPCWPELFQLEANRLRLALGSAIGEVEHVGSTAVPGLSAKPIIDMLAAVPSLAVARTLIARLELLGYEHRPDVPAPSRLFFALGPQTCRTHHLSLAEVGSAVWQDQTAVRDYLRAQPEVAAEYAVLKHQLAVQFAADRAAYTAAKEPFIHTLMANLHRQPQPPLGLGMLVANFHTTSTCKE